MLEVVVHLDVEIRPFSIRSASDAEYKALHAFRTAGRKEVLPEDPVIPRDEFIHQLLSLPDDRECISWAGWDPSGGTIRAFGQASLDNSGYKLQGADFSISVDQPLRRMGVGRELLRLVTETAMTRDRRLMWSQSTDRCPAGGAFLERIGAKKVLESHVNRLLLADLDRGIIRRWMQYPDDPSCRIAVGEWRGTFPEERIQEISDFYQAVYDVEPHLEGFETGSYRFTPEKIRQGERQHLIKGKERLIVHAVAADGRLLGFTEVTWSLSRPSIVQQWYTAVLPGFRNRGIGRRLKAEMLERILRDLPPAESIRSGNDDNNAAILCINTELGFRHFIANTTWQIETEAVAGYLASWNMNLAFRPDPGGGRVCEGV